MVSSCLSCWMISITGGRKYIVSFLNSEENYKWTPLQNKNQLHSLTSTSFCMERLLFYLQFFLTVSNNGCGIDILKKNLYAYYLVSSWNYLSIMEREKAKVFENQFSEWKIYLLLIHFKVKEEKGNQWGIQFSHCMALWTHQTNF